jgi:hypothetical protein
MSLPGRVAGPDPIPSVLSTGAPVTEGGSLMLGPDRHSGVTPPTGLQ